MRRSVRRFCFAASIVPPPPPAERPGVAKDQQQDGTVTEDATPTPRVIRTQEFVEQIPSFFVPIEEVLEQMPGYTESHLRKLAYDFKEGIPIIKFCGGTFIRMYGIGTYDMTPALTTNQRYAKYFPDPRLMEPFMPFIKAEWTPLEILLDKGGEAATKALPFQGPQSLVYFSQLQHLCQFTAERGGAVCRLKGPPNLNFGTSPCPIATSELARYLKDNPQSTNKVDAALSEGVKMDLRRYFKSWEHYVALHQPVFFLNKESEVLWRRVEYESQRIKSSSLQQQLIEAEKIPFNLNRKKIRNLRKKIATEANPDNPLLEKPVLAKSIADQLPLKGHLPMEKFIQKLPPTTVDLMPWKHTKFFQGFPEYFKLFEFKRPTDWHIQRSELPLPDGALRQTVTDEEAALEAAENLRRAHGNAMSVCSLAKKMSGPSRAIVAKRGGMSSFLMGYPEHFSMSQRRPDEALDSGSTVITLLKPMEKMRKVRGGGGNGGQRALLDDDDDD